MVEHVGPQFLETYFELVDRLLNAENGNVVFQSSTILDSIYRRTSTAKGFVSEYIFPGEYFPSATQLVEAINKGSSSRLSLSRVEYFGSHYARALRCWREDFLRSFDSNIRPALLRKFPSMIGSDIEIFRRKWQVRARALEQSARD
jgi:cyclopropane-fatty-acyl-phospholipid synthase